MFQEVSIVRSVQVDNRPVLRTSLQVIKNRTLDERHQAEPIINASYNFGSLQDNTNWKYTYPQGTTPLVDYSRGSLSSFPFSRDSVVSRSASLIHPGSFKFWAQQSGSGTGPLSDLGVGYDRLSRYDGFFLKSYNKSRFIDGMLSYYSQNEPVNFNVVNLPDYKSRNGFVIRNKQFVPDSYDHVTFIYRFYLKSINGRFQGRQNMFTSTLPPQSYFDSYSLVSYVQPLSLWMQDRDLYVNFTTEFKRQKNYLVRVKIPNAQSVFRKQLLNTIVVSYSVAQPIAVYINGIKYSPAVFQTGVPADGQPYDVLLFYKSTIGQYQSLGVCQSRFSMNRQQISAYTYIFGNRPAQLINTVDKYYEFKTLQDDGDAKQSSTHFGKWYNEFVISQNADNLVARDVFKHSFKDLLMISRPLSESQLDSLFGRNPIALLSSFDVGENADTILILDEQVALTNTSQTVRVSSGSVWNQLNFMYNESEFNEGSFQDVSETNQNAWLFYDVRYDNYLNCILNYRSDNILKNVRFSDANVSHATVTDVGFVSKKNGLLIITGDIFKVDGNVLDYMLVSTSYTDMLRQRNVYRKTYVCETKDSYLGDTAGTRYVTRVGLYDKLNRLLAVGSVSKPLALDENSRAKIKVRLEF